MDILVVLEEAQGSLHRLSKEAIVGAQELDGTVVALAIGKHCDQIASECSSYDLENVITVNHELISNYNADGYSEVVKQVIEVECPNMIVSGHSYQTRDFVPRVSAKLDIPFIPDIISLDNGYIKQVLNAKLNASTSFSTDQVIMSFQSAAFSEDNINLGSCSASAFDICLLYTSPSPRDVEESRMPSSA